MDTPPHEDLPRRWTFELRESSRSPGQAIFELDRSTAAHGVGGAVELWRVVDPGAVPAVGDLVTIPAGDDGSGPLTWYRCTGRVWHACPGAGVRAALLDVHVLLTPVKATT
jgi:hypothetical protein